MIRLVRRSAALGALLAPLLVVVVLAGAGPAVAQEADIRLRAPKSFTAGGKPGSASVLVTRREEGCVAVRVTLGIGLSGLAPDQVRVELDAGGDARPLAVSSGGAGVVLTERVVPERVDLCRRRDVGLRFRVTFLATAPAGRAVVAAEVFGPAGERLAVQTDTTRVASRRREVTPTPAAAPTPTPTPATPSPETTGAAAPPVAPPTAAAAGVAASGGGFLGVGTVVMFFGVVLVGIGVALLVLLVRRGRAERAAAGAGYPAPPGGYPAPPGGYPAPPGGYPAPPGGHSTRPDGYPDPGGAGDATRILPRQPG